jgi:hypothetical protein
MKHSLDLAASLIAGVSILFFATSCHTDLTVNRIRTNWDANHKIVEAQVANKGLKQASKVTVTFTVKKNPNDKSSIEETVKREIDTLRHASTTVRADFRELASPENGCLNDRKHVMITVDPDNKIKESDETNNSASALLQPRVSPFSDGPTATLQIETPPGTAVESRPVWLQFIISQNDRKPGQIQLQELRYLLYHGLSETKPFFSDTIVLYGKTGPGTLDVTPGIEYPSNVLNPQIVPSIYPVHITAELFYMTGGRRTSVLADAMISVSRTNSGIASQMYERYRDGFLRRHIVESGRELGPTWLKEYEPGKDRKELLWHSRTSTTAYQTRVYVPWVHICDGSECGKSVKSEAIAVYGGDENPLLKNGLAMSVFALEYLATNDQRSLQHSLKLFDYVERSEWKDPNQNYAPTGFFVRSNWPGLKDGEVCTECIFASVDELAGMSLGLLNLHRALVKAGHTYQQDHNRLIGLVDRLGKQLQDNFYFIAPLRREGQKWHEIGLPLEVQRGWLGAYPYQWFFANGFQAITGRSYAVGSYTGITDMFFSQTRDSTGTVGYIVDHLADLIDSTPHERAIASIQALGVALYYKSKGEPWRVPLPCVPDELTVSFSKFARFNFPMLLHVYQFGMANWSITPDERTRVNQEMARLISGVLNEGGDYTSLNLEILRPAEMLALWLLLGPEGVVIPLFCNNSPIEHIGTISSEDDGYAAAVALTYDLPSVYEPSPTSFPFPDATRLLLKQRYMSAIRTAIQGMTRDFSKELPVGERNIYACVDSNDIPKRTIDGMIQDCTADDKYWKSACAKAAYECPAGFSCKPLSATMQMKQHNPNAELGKDFSWEGEPSSRLMRSDGIENEGIHASTIVLQQEAEVDSMVEGAGLDFLLPMSMIREWSTRVQTLMKSNNFIVKKLGTELDHAIDDALGNSRPFKYLQPYQDSRVPQLPVCASDPVTAASDQRSPFYSPCERHFPTSMPDDFERPFRNDSLFTARTLPEWGVNYMLSFDRETLQTLPKKSATTAYNYVPIALYRDHAGHQSVIMPEGDRDFFTVESDDDQTLMVSSGSPVMTLDDRQLSSPVTKLSAGVSHVLMSTGAMGKYGITIRPVWNTISAEILTSSGQLDVALNRDQEKYHGHLSFKSAVGDLESTNVESIHGKDSLTTFEGQGSVAGIGGHKFRIVVDESCPRTLAVTITRPDNTALLAVEGVRIQSGSLVTQ